MAAYIYFSPGRWHVAPGGATEGTLLTGVLVAMWNFMGWDNASTVAGEVENPQRTYVKAMFYASLLVTLSYLIPVGACWLGGVDPSAWSTGAWADVASQVGGRWLSLGIVMAGVIFGVGMLNSCTMSYTRVPYAMAVDGWLPKSFTNLNRHGVPWVSVLACAVAWVAALSLGFVKLIELDVAIYGLSLVLEFIALIVLRIKEPNLSRPFRVPGGMLGAILIGIGPTTLVVLAVVDSYHQHITYFGFTLNNLAVSGAVILWGFLQYLFATRRQAVEAVSQNAD
jgi:amino acid transporter